MSRNDPLFINASMQWIVIMMYTVAGEVGISI